MHRRGGFSLHARRLRSNRPTLRHGRLSFSQAFRERGAGSPWGSSLYFSNSPTFQTARNIGPRSRGARRPSDAAGMSLLQLRGRREGRVSADTRGPRAAKKRTRRLPQVQPDIPALPARLVLMVSFALPGDRAFSPPSPARRVNVFTNLAPASGRQDHTTSPFAEALLVRAMIALQRLASIASRAQRP